MNAMQEEFCRQYFILRNGTRAAIAAGYSEKTARGQASRLLTNADILQRIRELEAEWRQSADIRTEDLIVELKSIAFAPMAEDEPRKGDDEAQMVMPFDDEFLPVIRRYERPARIGVKARDKISAIRELREILGVGIGTVANVNINIDELMSARARAAEVCDD